jgi:hypothetical protein
MSDRSDAEQVHVLPDQLSPARWAGGFAGAWLVGWVAVLSALGTSLVSALTQAIPMALALGGLAYGLRRYHS